MDEKTRGEVVVPRRVILVGGMKVIGGLFVARILPGCLGEDRGEPFGPPLVVGEHEHEMRLYEFLADRYVVGYIPKRQGPFIVEMGGVQGDFEFLRNGDEDPLNDQGKGTLHLRVNQGEEWQPYRRQFADAEESMRFETMDPEDARIMAEIND